MSAQITSLGILAGEGELPHILVDTCLKKGIKPVLILFQGCSYRQFPHNVPVLETRLEHVGKIFNYLKANKVSDVVLIGNLVRPSVSKLRPDFKGIRTLARLGKAMIAGDDNLLKSLRNEIEREGFAVHGIDRFVDYLTLEAGSFTKAKPDIDIQSGMRESINLGLADKGQSILMHEDGSFSYESFDGTAALIDKHGRAGSVLFKAMKPQQDPDLDRPTVGLHTLKTLHKNKCAGLVVEADKVFVIQQKDCIEFADQHGLFIEAANVR